MSVDCVLINFPQRFIERRRAIYGAGKFLHT